MRVYMIVAVVIIQLTLVQTDKEKLIHVEKPCGDLVYFIDTDTKFNVEWHGRVTGSTDCKLKFNPFKNDTDLRFKLCVEVKEYSIRNSHFILRFDSGTKDKEFNSEDEPGEFCAEEEESLTIFNENSYGIDAGSSLSLDISQSPIEEGFDDGNLPIYVIAAVGAALVLCIFSGCVRSCNRQRQAASPRYAEDIPAIQYQSSSSYVELDRNTSIQGRPTAPPQYTHSTTVANSPRTSTWETALPNQNLNISIESSSSEDSVIPQEGNDAHAPPTSLPQAPPPSYFEAVHSPEYRFPDLPGKH